MAQCYSKLKNFDQAICIIDEVIAATKNSPTKTEKYAFALVEKANILGAKGEFTQAVSSQE